MLAPRIAHENRRRHEHAGLADGTAQRVGSEEGSKVSSEILSPSRGEDPVVSDADKARGQDVLDGDAMDMTGEAAKPFWPGGPVLALLGVVLAVAGSLTYSSFIRARDAADASCLASIHAALDGADLPDSGQETASWRTWSQDQIKRTLARQRSYGDCPTAADASWRSSLRIRSRQVAHRTELQLWLHGRPQVSSPWGAEGLE